MWDCLDQCKERLWDIEISHDAAAGLLASWEERKALEQAAADCDGVADASNCSLSDDPDEISVLRTGLGPREPEAASDDLLRMAGMPCFLSRLRVFRCSRPDSMSKPTSPPMPSPPWRRKVPWAPRKPKEGARSSGAWATTNGVPDEVPPTQHLRTQSSA